ncbi:MAG: AtpZ/AtpI family protein [Candidatus Falkowbacteria bacterium]
MPEKDQKSKNVDFVEPLKIATRLSAWIGFPVVIGYLIGSYLDRKYNSSPKWFLIVIGISFFISMFGLVRSALAEYKKISLEVKDKKD